MRSEQQATPPLSYPTQQSNQNLPPLTKQQARHGRTLRNHGAKTQEELNRSLTFTFRVFFYATQTSRTRPTASLLRFFITRYCCGQRRKAPRSPSSRFYRIRMGAGSCLSANEWGNANKRQNKPRKNKQQIGGETRPSLQQFPKPCSLSADYIARGVISYGGTRFHP